jgi:hypothetical protein
MAAQLAAHQIGGNPLRSVMVELVWNQFKHRQAAMRPSYGKIGTLLSWPTGLSVPSAPSGMRGYKPALSQRGGVLRAEVLKEILIHFLYGATSRKMYQLVLIICIIRL